HAAAASLAAYPRIVWIAGGQLNGADVDALVAAYADRLAGAGRPGVGPPPVGPARARPAPAPPAVRARAHAAGDSGAPARVAAPRGCWPRRRPPRTCSRATAGVATRSPRRCGHSGRSRYRGGRDVETEVPTVPGAGTAGSTAGAGKAVREQPPGPIAALARG